MTHFSPPRTLPFGNATLLSVGQGRSPGAFAYINTQTNAAVELLLARVIHISPSGATVAFTNPNLNSALLPGNPQRMGLSLHQQLLIHPSYTPGGVTVQHWFPVHKTVVPRPSAAPVPFNSIVGVITRIAPDFTYCFATTSTGETYFVSAQERVNHNQPFLLHAKVRFTPSRNARGNYALRVMAA